MTQIPDGQRRRLSPLIDAAQLIGQASTRTLARFWLTALVDSQDGDHAVCGRPTGLPSTRIRSTRSL